MKFAYLIMVAFDDRTDRAEIHHGTAQIIGVANLESAIRVAGQLQQEGVDCIELCGAFGAEGSRQIMAATQRKLPIGYVTHLKEQDEIYQMVFSRQ